MRGEVTLVIGGSTDGVATKADKLCLGLVSMFGMIGFIDNAHLGAFIGTSADRISEFGWRHFASEKNFSVGQALS